MTQLEAQIGALRLQVRQAQQLSNLGTAAATVVHEFNNLLAPMLSYARYALTEKDPELTQKALETTVKSTQVLVAMSDRLLALSSAKPPAFRLTSLRLIIDEAVACLCRDFSKDRVRFRCLVDDSVKVWGDPLHLQQVFFNLLLNARSALGKTQGGDLTVTAEAQDERVVVEVRDTGPGVAPGLLERIFEPFATTRTADAEGRTRCGGLGLALCRDIVEESGGTISVTSEVGRGTTFTIVLSAVEAEPTDAPVTCAAS
ncbi:MAG TPA: HAMP domain-containing sensor histidine kinase [Phycisphaerae bacterium]|nr:HAMP domain-containing sensor histidine kinase [Phycisphaerae bacterium]HNU43989.1 HAMP domain-containing sensor histidine kinase [Phycisphaerae bacterium]